MHDAYEATPILKVSVQIESMAAYDDNLLIGTREGHLLIYNVPPKFNEYGKLELLSYSKNFSKKRIVQVDVVPEFNLLILLSDDIICVHDLNSLNIQQINQLPKTKGATLFALDVQEAESLTGEKNTVVRLCVAVKRKLQLYYWKGRENQFKDLGVESRNELSLPDVPRELAWCGETLIVGFHGISYTLLSLEGKMKELFPTGKPPKPSITKLSDSSFALGKDSQSIIMDTSGELIQHNPVKWTDSPSATAWDDPYLLGIVHDTLEVYTLEGSLHIQTLQDLNKSRLLCRCKQGRVYIASISQVWCVSSVDVELQIRKLLEQNQFQLALKLTSLSDATDDDKQKRTYKIQTLYAHHLFCSKKFQEAMKQFHDLGTDPYEVIRLFPHLVDSGGANDVNEPVTSLPKLQDRDLENGLLALIGFLTEVRHNLMGGTDVKEKDGKREDGKKDRKSMTAAATEQLLKIIDTTLLKCYLQTNDALVAPLLRLNHCHLAEAEKTLLQHQKYPELIILYQTKGQHKKALELLEKQSKQSDSSLKGTERTIQYLQHLGKEHIELILKFSGWVLEQDPEQGLRIFIEDIQEVEQLPRPKVLDYLLRQHKSLVITYLEYVVRVWEDENSLFHNILVHQYKEKCLAGMSPTATPAERQNAEHVRQKLQQFLEKSVHYTPETVLVQFPSDSLFEERAIILGRLGRHHQAISIYVNLLNDVPRAIKYCHNVYAGFEGQRSGDGVKSTDGADEVYVTLIQQLLKPEPVFMAGNSEIQKTAQPDLETALELLEQYAPKVSPIKALEVLPDTVPIGRIRHFLEASLQNQLNERRRTQILKGLLHAEHLQVQEQRMHYESQSVLMTEFNICSVCKKRFGNQSAFARYSNGEIVHYSCQERKS
ncbi:vam6/Vps39-like protein [Fopius arisanus]|uniref:Vam6/Vps39-like protein n=3 Tax=Fopius arisanus TaxID=64838 RepID=A0A0C9RQW9_9HYME|nr:PREDICTED: vam6/Vps39-like protein [Fopius arisanus]XP_011301040.1 PREDICTED: vam6/Vps39-like protein [Fopius arisanus]